MVSSTQDNPPPSYLGRVNFSLCYEWPRVVSGARQLGWTSCLNITRALVCLYCLSLFPLNQSFFFTCNVLPPLSNGKLKCLLKWNFCIVDFCIILKYKPYLQTVFFRLRILESAFFGCLKLEAWTRNLRPSWRRKISLLTSWVAYIWELRVNPG